MAVKRKGIAAKPALEWNRPRAKPLWGTWARGKTTSRPCRRTWGGSKRTATDRRRRELYSTTAVQSRRGFRNLQPSDRATAPQASSCASVTRQTPKQLCMYYKLRCEADSSSIRRMAVTDSAIPGFRIPGQSNKTAALPELLSIVEHPTWCLYLFKLFNRRASKYYLGRSDNLVIRKMTPGNTNQLQVTERWCLWTVTEPPAPELESISRAHYKNTPRSRRRQRCVVSHKLSIQWPWNG